MSNQPSYTQLVTGIVALLVVIIAGVMIFWQISDSLVETGTVSETFTGYSHGDNASSQTVELDDVPHTVSNVTCWSSTAGTLSYPTSSFNGRDLTVGTCSNYTQINVSYTSEKGESAEEANDMFTTLVPLMVIIALVLVAGVIIGIISRFGQ
jgi:hypothetical protein